MHFHGTAIARPGVARLAIVSIALALLACSTRVGLDARQQQQAEARADQLIAAAERIEPTLTPRLERLAKDVGGSLYGAAYRIKKRSSTVRKIRIQLQTGRAASVADASLRDPLRYTIVVSDTPSGHYLEALERVLRELARSGQSVERVRNYWLRDDDYNGINVSLRDPSGLVWELQLHTPASKKAQIASHALYRVYRLPETPIAEKRVLFREMTAIADAVDIPSGVLGPEPLHAVEERPIHAAP